MLKNNYNSFLDYVKNEFEIFQTRKNLMLYEYGQTERYGDSSYWFVVKNKEVDSLKSYSYCLYLDKNESDTCFLLQSVVFGEESWRSRICELNMYLHTFRVNN